MAGHKRNRLYLCPRCSNYRALLKSDVPLDEMIALKKAGKMKSITKVCEPCLKK